ncbi:MAG: hypothetical protein RL456_57 [Pseudomonadota bacterium]
MSPNPPPRVGRLLAVMALLLTSIFGGIAWLQTQSLTLLNANALYQGDNTIWSFFQLESEYLRLGHHLRVATTAPPGDVAGMMRLRERYEVFVSRIDLVEPSRTRIDMPEIVVQGQVIAALRTVVARMDTVLGPDAPEIADPQALAALVPAYEALGPAVRDLSLQANQVIGESMAQRNEAVRFQNRIGIGLTLFQCLLILVFAVIVVRQVRALEQRRRTLEELAARLQEARAEAEQASRAKSAFLANMSHELRTPFNGLLGMMSMLDRSELTAQQREFLTIARQSGEHLLTILNDVLDFSKMESGRLQLVPQPVDLRQVVRDVQALMQPQARVKSLQFDVEIAEDLHPAVEADAKRLRQVLFNLLGNAIKFTDRGRVALHLDQVTDARGERLTRFRVLDTGIGMSEDTRLRLFQRFSQGDDSINRRFGGTGLGLEISRTLAQMMGGEITVTSEPGRGSEFTVVLPLPRAEAPAPAAVRPATGERLPDPVPVPQRLPNAAGEAGSPRSLHILVADDHPVNRRFMQVLLERLGHQVAMAVDGQEALAAVRGQGCDLVLMDVHMPVMDGLAATRAIRELPLPRSRVPIIALTADAFAESRERVREAGMDDFLAKPVQMHDVEDMLRRHFGARVIGETAVGGAGAAVPVAAATAADAAPAAALPRGDGGPPAVRRPALGDVGSTLDVPFITDTCEALTVEGYGSLLEGFFADDSRTLADLIDSLDAGRTGLLKEQAHRLKGTASNLGLKRLAEAARAVELRLAEGHGNLAADAMPALADGLREALAASRAACVRMGWLEATTEAGPDATPRA